MLLVPSSGYWLFECLLVTSFLQSLTNLSNISVSFISKCVINTLSSARRMILRWRQTILNLDGSSCLFEFISLYRLNTSGVETHLCRNHLSVFVASTWFLKATPPPTHTLKNRRNKNSSKKYICSVFVYSLI